MGEFSLQDIASPRLYANATALICEGIHQELVLFF